MPKEDKISYKRGLGLHIKLIIKKKIMFEEEFKHIQKGNEE